MPQGASAGPYRKFPGLGYYGPGKGLAYYEPQFPFVQGASAGPYPRFLSSPSHNGLAGPSGVTPYRPNQGFFRGNTPGVSKTLGDGIDFTSIDLTDPTTLLVLIGGGFLAWQLLKGVGSARRSVGRYQKRRRARAAVRAQLASL
jgi:hypothetical protein